MRRVLSILFAVMVLASAGSAETLADVLRKYQLKLLPKTVRADVPITSYAVLDTPKLVGVAYYEVDPREPDALFAPLRLVMFDRIRRVWSERKYTNRDLGMHEECVGSVLELSLHGKYPAATIHLNPSAVCTLVFAPDLSIRDVLYGWPVASFASGAMIVQRSEVHFASTHPLELDGYDPETKVLTPLMPLPDDQVRAGIVGELRAKRDVGWCRENNASCDPEKPEGNLGEVRVDDKTRAAALKVTYESIGFGPKAEESVGDTNVIYVFDLSGAKPRFRSFRTDDFEKKFGTTQLDEILTPSILKRVFPS